WLLADSSYCRFVPLSFPRHAYMQQLRILWWKPKYAVFSGFRSALCCCYPACFVTSRFRCEPGQSIPRRRVWEQPFPAYQFALLAHRSFARWFRLVVQPFPLPLSRLLFAVLLPVQPALFLVRQQAAPLLVQRSESLQPEGLL